MSKVNRYKGRGGGQGHPRQNNYVRNYNAASTTATKKYWAITKGLETVLFTFRNSKDAAEFDKTKTTLSRYVSTQAWQGSGIAP